MEENLTSSEADRLIVAALSEADQMYKLGLSTCKGAVRIVRQFMVIHNNEQGEEVAAAKSREIADALWQIGMKINPRQFGEIAYLSTEPWGDDDSTNIVEPEINPRDKRALAYLQDAARLLGLPRDYYIKRRDFSRAGPEKPNGPIADQRPEIQVNANYRPPKIEAMSEAPFFPEPQQANRLWQLVGISCQEDTDQLEKQDYSHRGKSTDETNAIRTFIRLTDIDQNFLDYGEGVSRPWAAIAEMLNLVGCAIESKTVRQVIKSNR